MLCKEQLLRWKLCLARVSRHESSEGLVQLFGCFWEYLEDLIKYPEHGRASRIVVENEFFQNKVRCIPGGVECLLSLGYRWEDGCLVISQPDPSLLQEAQRLLELALISIVMK